MKRLLTLINNEQVVFVESLDQGGMRLVASCPFSEVLESGFPLPLTRQLLGSENQLLLVPDYWLGIKSFLLATNRSRLVHSFIRKKLELEVGEGLGTEDFYDYIPYVNDDGEQGLTVYYSHEAHLATFHAALQTIHLLPRKISTPGLLWEEKLRETQDDFSTGGKLLIHTAGSDSTFFFFHQGRFLFSRDLGLPAEIDPAELATLLGSEIQQTRFLFSQKARAEIDQVYYVAARGTDVDLPLLSERIGKPVLPLDFPRPAGALDPAALINPIISFAPDDWGRKSHIVNFAHRLARTEYEWKTAQIWSIACAAVVMILLFAQTILLGMQLSDADFRLRNQAIREKSALLNEFSGRIDQIASRRQIPSTTNALVQLSRSLPANVTIDGFTLDVASGKKLLFTGQVNADGPEAFRATLVTLSEKLRAEFPGNEALTYRNIQFTTGDRTTADEPLSAFKISFEVAL